MKPTKIKAVFENEAALCSAFIAALPEGWTAYPETSGFDIVLVRGADGAQIGVEAKMTLNAKVLKQAVQGMYSSWSDGEGSGPDFRAVLVPAGTAGAEMRCIANYLGVVVIEANNAEARASYIAERVESYKGWGFANPEAVLAYAEKEAARDFPAFTPELPGLGQYSQHGWRDHCPLRRCHLPDYVPDVVAGASGPSSLSEWKIKAIKICIILERRGYVTPKDFAHLRIDRKRWLDMGWLKGDEGVRGQYVPGDYPINLRVAHPVNFVQIEADWDKWKPADDAAQFQAAMI